MSDRERMLAAVAGIPNVKFAPRWDDPKIAGKGLWTPSRVMLHHTAGTNSLALLRDGVGHKPVPGAHVLISRDGTVHVLTCRKAYHAGRGGPRWGIPAGMYNAHGYGVEVESLGLRPDFTHAQTQAAGRFAAQMLAAMGQPTDNADLHREWNPTGKPHDPRYFRAEWHQWIDLWRTKEPAVTYKTPADGVWSEKLDDVRCPKGGEKVLRTLNLPAVKGARWLLEVQGHVPKGAVVDVRFVRVGWGAGQVGGLDPTGSGTFGRADRADKFCHSHTISGGGPVRFTWTPDVDMTLPWVVVKATCVPVAKPS